VLSILSPQESSKLERKTLTFAIKTVEICIDDKLSTTSMYTLMKMWQIYSRKHLLMISIWSSQKRWVYGNLRLDLRLVLLFFVYMDSHPQAMLVLFPCSLVT
jgi:hypothetical protein